MGFSLGTKCSRDCEIVRAEKSACVCVYVKEREREREQARYNPHTDTARVTAYAQEVIGFYVDQ